MKQVEPRLTYADADLTFYLQVCRDSQRAEWCLENLRRQFPTSRVIVVSDGDPDRRYAAFIDRYRVEFHIGEELYPLRHGGRIIERMLGLWGANTAYLFNIDTDTLIHHRFRWLPGEKLAVFGNGLPTQGGCVGFTQAAGASLLESGLLADPILTCPEQSWAVMADGTTNEVVLQIVRRDGRVRTDWLIGWCCRQLGITQIHFAEVFSQWRDPVPDGLDVAVSHPHKQIPLDREEL
ncbi:MAG: glycosyltransferase family A protein [Planctomycetaceae bacterium]